MNRKKTRLELTWIGKDERPKLEPRILLEDPEKSYHASVRRPGDIFDNMLIHGDNLLALKALEADFAGQVKCVYIDPPFNTGQAFEHYDDGVEHSMWLSLMRERTESLRAMLAPDGVMAVHLNIDELSHYKVLCDELFGRSNFLQLVTVRAASTASFRATNLCPVTVSEYILLYAKDRAHYSRPMQYVRAEFSEDYGSYIKNRESDSEQWELVSLQEMVHANHGFQSWRDAKEAWGPRWKDIRRAEMEAIALSDPDSVVSLNTLQKPSDKIQAIIDASKKTRGRVFRLDRERAGPIYTYNGRTLAFFSKKLRAVDGEIVPTDVLTNIWTDISYLSLGKEGGVKFPNGKKPESLLRRLINITTEPGDIILDSFLGSGTTAAVAHKMGRRWIGVELGQHAETHCFPRLKSVVDGSDSCGVTDVCQWAGGGGFRYYRLAPSLLQKDEYGNWIINKDYNAAMLAEALCKIEGFKYDPSPEVYWQQGRSTETDYIFVTTQTMTADMLQKLSDEVGPDRSLLIMCKAFRSKREWPNLTVKKIPKAVLVKCEWGQDDYSLEIKELPVVEDEPEATDAGPQVEPKASGAVKKRRRKAASVASGNLFSSDEAEGEGA